MRGKIRLGLFILGFSDGVFLLFGGDLFEQLASPVDVDEILRNVTTVFPPQNHSKVRRLVIVTDCVTCGLWPLTSGTVCCVAFRGRDLEELSRVYFSWGRSFPLSFRING